MECTVWPQIKLVCVFCVAIWCDSRVGVNKLYISVVQCAAKLFVYLRLVSTSYSKYVTFIKFNFYKCSANGLWWFCLFFNVSLTENMIFLEISSSKSLITSKKNPVGAI